MSLKLAILVSGRGSNMSAILDAIENKELDAEVQIVFSNNPAAAALVGAQKRGVKTATISHRGIAREHHEKQLLELLAQYEIDFVVLAGYMRVLSENFLRAFRHENAYYRIINIHPSLLPAFPGAHAYEDAFAAAVRLSGITVHLVDEKVDHGPILAQEPFERKHDDDLETFRQRGLAVEHRLLPRVLQEIASSGIKLLNSDILVCPLNKRSSNGNNLTEKIAANHESAKQEAASQ